MFLFPTLNWNESYSFSIKPDKLQFTMNNYIGMCVCRNLLAAAVAVVVAAAAEEAVGGGRRDVI